MKNSEFQDGLTVRVIAGTHNVILGFDLAEERRKGCLGFSIEKTVMGAANAAQPPTQPVSHYLPNLLRFPNDTNDADNTLSTTDVSPVQRFRWGDWTVDPGITYQYTVTAQYGQPGQLIPGPCVSVEVTTEDSANPATAVFFNRGAAASRAFTNAFQGKGPEDLQGADLQRALNFLARGLDQAILNFLGQAADSHYALHAAIYEFQKPELLAGLKAARDRGAEVKVVYHHRKANPKDDTWSKNDAAAQAAGIADLCALRQANPQGAISHNKFVVLLKDGAPQAVWTGSTNWTDGALYGQLNVGQAFYDSDLAAKYEAYFQLLHTDPAHEAEKDALIQIVGPIPTTPPGGPCYFPIFSPQKDRNMLTLYGQICSTANSLLVCAPFELAPEILKTFQGAAPQGKIRFVLADKLGSLGDKQQVSLLSPEFLNEVSVATTISSPLHDYQNKLLEGKESYHHAGIHIHAKIIAANPLSDDPILVVGSANFSSGSTLDNDSNSILIRGYPAIGDIYVSEFMRVYDSYLFRYHEEQANKNNQPLGLATDDSWSAEDYQNPGRIMTRQFFAGTGG